MRTIEIKKARRPILNPTKMKVQVGGLYQDKLGRVWRAVESMGFGRWMLRRDDRCILWEARTIDMQAAEMKYVGQAA